MYEWEAGQFTLVFLLSPAFCLFFYSLNVHLRSENAINYVFPTAVLQTENTEALKVTIVFAPTVTVKSRAL